MSVGTLLHPGEIPDKLYFKIGEVCEMTGIKSHTLRFWETEFSVIRPRRAGSNQRLYRRQDVECILKIKRLIQEDGHTIAGARKFLAQERKKGNKSVGQIPSKADLLLLRKIKNDLLKLRVLLDK